MITDITILDSMGTDLSIVNAALAEHGEEHYWYRPILRTWVAIHPHNGEEQELHDYGEKRLSDEDVEIIKALVEEENLEPFEHGVLSLKITHEDNTFEVIVGHLADAAYLVKHALSSKVAPPETKQAVRQLNEKLLALFPVSWAVLNGQEVSTNG